MYCFLNDENVSMIIRCDISTGTLVLDDTYFARQDQKQRFGFTFSGVNFNSSLMSIYCNVT